MLTQVKLLMFRGSKEVPGAPLIVYPRHDGPNQVFRVNEFKPAKPYDVDYLYGVYWASY